MEGHHPLDTQAPAKNSGWRADAKFLLLSHSRPLASELSAALAESSPYSKIRPGCPLPTLLAGDLKPADAQRRHSTNQVPLD